jgi:hypothetical protein
MTTSFWLPRQKQHHYISNMIVDDSPIIVIIIYHSFMSHIIDSICTCTATSCPSSSSSSPTFNSLLCQSSHHFNGRCSWDKLNVWTKVSVSSGGLQYCDATTAMQLCNYCDATTAMQLCRLQQKLESRVLHVLPCMLLPCQWWQNISDGNITTFHIHWESNVLPLVTMEVQMEAGTLRNLADSPCR